MRVGEPKSENYTKEHLALSDYQRLRRIWLAAAIAVLSGVMLFVGTAWKETGHELIEVTGASLIGAAILGRLWCTLYIGGRKSDSVVRSGPYSIMRNPLYFFSAVGAAGVGAQSGSLTVAVAFGLLCMLAFLVVIRREEQFLAGHFGAVYQDYLKSVPRFFPNFRLFQDEDALTVIPKRIYVTLMDGLVFFAALPAFEAVEYFQDTGAVPVLLRLY